MLEIKQNKDGWEYGVCIFEDNRQCEEWALMQWNCPVWWIKVTGYENDEQKYCAIRGGSVDMENKKCEIDWETFSL